MDKQVICMWTGPRNVSTAMMYSFDSRADCTGVDEPFYAYYLHTTKKEHPMYEEILRAHPTNPILILEKEIFREVATPLLFVKNMPHHMLDLSLDFVNRMTNFFLIREPEAMISSFIKKIANPTMADLGLKKQWEIFEQLQKKGETPAVVDTTDILANPKDVLTSLCQNLNIPMDAAMLEWSPGARACDGAWAPYWYANVHASKGFSAAQPTAKPEVPEHLQSLLSECRYYYDLLHQHRITK